MTLYSSYGMAAFGSGEALFLLLTVIPAFVAGCHFKCKGQKTKTSARIYAGVCIFVGLFGILSIVNPVAWEVLPLGAGIAICIIWCVIVTPFVALLLSPNIGPLLEDDVKADVDFAMESEEPPKPVDRTFSATGVDVSNAPTTESGPRSKMSANQRFRHDISTRFGAYALIFGLFFLFSLAMFLSMYGACFCVNPVEVTSWASRRSKARACQPNQPCYSYTTVGSNCRNLMLVSHLIVTDDRISKNATATVVPLSDFQLGVNSSVMTFWGPVVAVNDIQEDLRFVAQIRLTGLLGNTTYRIQVRFDVAPTSPAILHVVTIPCFVAATDKLQFVGGGDYDADGSGKALLRVGMQKAPLAAFVYIAGDLVYANNMRRCYRRWDDFVLSITEVATRATNDPTIRAQIPFLFCTGNHEGGGYLQLTTEADRKKYYTLYNEFFPHISRTPIRTNDDFANNRNTTDWSLTFHDHDIAGVMVITMLDSHIMVKASDQTSFLFRSLSTASTPIVLPMYHNPAFPSHRPYDDPICSEVRNYFIPIFDQYSKKIPLVFEHHDHTFKRTVPILNGRQVANTSGIVYVGDGALGVGGGRSVDTRRWYIEKAYDSSYVSVVSATVDGSIQVDCYQGEGRLLDTTHRQAQL
jgi:hypothetical protein